MSESLLEQSISSNVKAAERSLPKGNIDNTYQPVEITFPKIEVSSSIEPSPVSKESYRAQEIDAQAISDAVFLESLRFARYLENDEMI